MTRWSRRFWRIVEEGWLWLLMAVALLVVLLGAFKVLGDELGEPGQPVPIWMPHHPVREDAVGPGVHRDATGRLFEYRTRDGERAQGRVRPNRLGPGIGVDATGRPVRAQQWPPR